jgi:peptide/nickel transport system substrate-binding protein
LISVLMGAAVVVAGPATAASSKQTVDTNATVSVAFASCTASLDPHVTSTYPDDYLYDELLGLNKAKQVRPNLATAWTTSKDGLTVTLTLRKGVTFVDGSTFDSASVKATLLRGLSKPDVQAVLSAISTIETPDPYTAVLKLSHPDATLLSTLAAPYAGRMISAKALAANLSLVTSDQGAGSTGYKVVSWTNPGSSGVLIVERAPGFKYWDPKMWRVKRFELHCGVTDATTLLNGIKTNAYQVITGNPITTKDLQSALVGTNAKAIPFGAEKLEFLALYPKGPLASVAVRTALFQAIDLTTLSKSGGIPGLDCTYPAHNQLVFPSDPGYVKTGFKSPLDYNQQAAAAVLRPLNLNFVLNFRSARADAQAEAEFIQAQLKAVGVTVTLTAMPSAQLGLAYASGALQAMTYAGTGSADPVNGFNNLFGAARGSAGPAFATDVKPKMDAANALPSGSATRAKALTELDTFLLSQAWVRPYCVGSFSNAATNNVRGVADMPLQFVNQIYGRTMYVVK